MGTPQILVPDNAGIHNASDYATRLEKQKTYRDLIPARIVQSWQGMFRPMNQNTFSNWSGA